MAVGKTVEVNDLCQNLVQALNIVMSLDSQPDQRIEAYKFCEEVKENSPCLTICGRLMSTKTNSAVVRHFGLQLLEHCIKFRWNNMNQEEKLQLKEDVLKIIAEGTLPIMEEEAHIKDVASRLVVEMAKREWPQQWPEMLDELKALCKRGKTQTDLVLLVLVRLVEDVICFNLLPTQRRRDIQQALNVQLGNIFEFICHLLEHHASTFQQLQKNCSSEEQRLEAMAHGQIAKGALRTLAGFLEWVSMSQVMANGSSLLLVLCSLLNNPVLQMDAADALLLILNPKGEDRKPLLMLFNDAAMLSMLQAAESAHEAGLNEKGYLFLKRICQLLVGLGLWLAGIWGVDPKVERPSNFKEFLTSMLAFTNHLSQYLSSLVESMWIIFLQHKIISNDPIMLEFLPQLLQCHTTKIAKCGHPSGDYSPSCQYSRLDFEGDEEFSAFFASYRAQLGECVRLCCRLQPEVAFQIAKDSLLHLLPEPIDTGCSSGQGSGLCTFSSPSFLKWDAMATFLENTMSQLFSALEKKGLGKPPAEEGLAMMRQVLDYNSNDPLVHSSCLSCVSALLPFLSFNSFMLSQVLDKLLNAVTFSLNNDHPPGHNVPINRAVKNLRRHACSSLVKISREQPELLMVRFASLDLIYSIFWRGGI
uniref:exportin-5-like n=1 Tax=Myxine glutinosa TaxID=7769 RepID=UPI00358FCC8B